MPLVYTLIITLSLLCDKFKPVMLAFFAFFHDFLSKNEKSIKPPLSVVCIPHDFVQEIWKSA